MISIAIGIGIGWFIQEFFVTLLKDYFPTNLPKAGINPLIISALTVIICLTGFCLPYLVKLVNISPLAILRKEKSDFSFNSIFFTLVPLAAMFFLLLLYTKDLLLSSIMFFVIIGACLIGISIVFILFRKNNLIGLGAENTDIDNASQIALGNIFIQATGSDTFKPNFFNFLCKSIIFYFDLVVNPNFFNWSFSCLFCLLFSISWSEFF